MDDRTLLDQARTVRKNAYCPYSRYAVGAALLGESGAVYLGCNLENAALSVICAERSAVAQAIAAGERSFLAVAVAGGPAAGPDVPGCFPCGVCRQMLYEFGGSRLAVITAGQAGPLRQTLGELLPNAFGPRDLSFLKGDG